MEILIWILTAIGLGAGLAMDACAVSMSNGLAEPKMKTNKILTIAGFFGAFQIIMPILGYLAVTVLSVALGERFTKIFGYLVPWIALTLLLILGIKMIVEGIKEAGAEAELIAAADFGAAKVKEYDGIAFGCPAMGDEVLEESEFAPMFDECKPELPGKKVALFGSYGWGTGEWMENWEADCAASGIKLATDSVIANEMPDEEALAACKALGAALV